MARADEQPTERCVSPTMRTVPLPLANSPAQVRARLHVRRESHKVHFPGALSLWHLASMDAPTVAVVWALAFAWAGGLRLPAWVPVMLAMGTWTVYIGDRLLDARTGLRTGAADRLRERHFFHWRQRKALLPLALATGGTAAAIILLRMPVAIRERNVVLGAAALAYFSGVHAPGGRWLQRLPKELLVGVLFAAGCALPTLTRLRLMGNAWEDLAPLLVAATAFAALAWLNCHAIERWESDVVDDASKVWKAAAMLALTTLGLALLMAGIDAHRIALLLLCAAGSALLTGGLDRMRGRLAPLALRTAADLVLLTPLVCLLR